MFLEATKVGVPSGFSLSPLKEVQLQLGSMEVGLDLCFGVSLGGCEIVWSGFLLLTEQLCRVKT